MRGIITKNHIIRMSTPTSILRVAIPSPLRKTFDYLPPLIDDSISLKPGMRLKVPFGKREIIGILLELSTTSLIPLHQLKTVSSIIDKEPLIPETLLKLYHFASDYYHYPLGAAIAASCPVLLRQAQKISVNREKKNGAPSINTEKWKNESEFSLNEHQQFAINSIIAARDFQTFLLWGVTGSGKTEVYLQCVEQIIQRQRQALILIPEIGLTPQTLRRFQDRFSVCIIVLHSNLSPKERARNWLMAKTGQARIIIGTRSAIFTPLADPGIIIVDEEHDSSFKQQSGFRYSARDLAVFRGNLDNIPVVLGSATPSLETLHNATSQRYQMISLPERVSAAHPPTVHFLDIRQKKLIAGLCDTLLQAIEIEINAGNQALLFLNRRGYAPTLLCHSCGFVIHCTHCDAHLTLHHHPKRLCCHHCGAQKEAPRLCPQCQQSEFIPVGLGTEQLENTLKNHFPHWRMVRLDRDNTRRKNSLSEKINDIQTQQVDIIIGTQMIAKGHHFPHLTLVAIVDADNGLYGSDFRASEKMGQLLQQVAGRAGREKKAGSVFIQTHHPDHPLLQTLVNSGYESFAELLLKERKSAQLPPFTHMALLHAQSRKKNMAYDFLIPIKAFILSESIDVVELFGPIPAVMERKAGYYHYQLMLQSAHRPTLHHILKKLVSFLSTQPARSVRWSLDIDPQDNI